MHRITRRALLRTAGVSAGTLALGTAAPAAALDALGTARAADVAGEALKLARVWVTRETAHLLGDFDDTHNVFEDGSVELLLWPGDLGRLVATGLRHEVTVADLIARDAAMQANAEGRPADLRPQPGETEGEYRDLDAFNADMRMLAEQNPEICRLIELPFRSLQGRTVLGVEIAADVTRTDGRPVYYNDGVHHAREWPAAEMPIMWAFDLISSYWRHEGQAGRAYDQEVDPQDARMHNIVVNARNIIVPVVNPDGYDYSRTGVLGTGRTIDSSLTGQVPVAGMQYWRKNMRVYDTGVIPLPDGESGLPQTGILPTTVGAIGVDCNRNYAYRWGGDGSSASQTSATYRGAEPFSEPEARNVQWIHQSWQCVSGITHHTSGDLVLWAWGDTHDDAPDDVLLARLGFACGDYNGYRPTKSIDLYVTTGTCSDHIYGAYGSIAYTFEHAGSSFHPPYGDVVPSFYAANREALMLMCELVCLEPEQRGFMLDAVAANPDVRYHLTGDFSEVISGTDYTYEGNPLDLTARHNAVLTGRLVDVDGNPVQGLVTNFKAYANPLSPGNPIDQAEWAEAWSSTITTAEDGTFRWVVYPSTRPALFAEGQTEPVAIVGEADGFTGTREDVVVVRGEVLDLGDIVLDQPIATGSPSI